MVCTCRFLYDGRVIIFIGVDIGRRLLTVYIAPLASSVIIIIIIVVIFLSRDVVLIGLAIVWLGVGDFELQSAKEFQSDGGSPREPLGQLTNTSGDQQRGLCESGDYTASVEVMEVVATVDVTRGTELQRLKRPGLHGVFPVLVSLDVLSELKETMLAELDGLAINDSFQD